MAKIELEVLSDGTIRTQYDEGVVALVNTYVGTKLQTIKRASNVEWEDAEKAWTVRAAHDPELAIRLEYVLTRLKPIVSRDPIYSVARFTTRDEAIKAELDHFWDLLPPKEL